MKVSCHALAIALLMAAPAAAQTDPWKGERAPNPTVKRPASNTGGRARSSRPAAPRLSAAEQIEIAIDRGNTARDEDKLDEAEKQYRRAIALNRNEWRAWYGLGNVLNDGGSYDPAIDALREALRLNDSAAEAHHSLGTSFFMKEQYPNAVEQYSASVRLRSDYTYAYYDLGMTYVKLKDRDQALRQYEILKTMNPGLAANLRSYIR